MAPGPRYAHCCRTATRNTPARRSSRPTCTTPTSATRRRPQPSATARCRAHARHRDRRPSRGRRGPAHLRPAEPPLDGSTTSTSPTSRPSPSRRRVRGLGAGLTALITDGDTAPVPRADPHAARRPPMGPLPGVTLLGDAGHLMAPRRGRQPGHARRRRARRRPSPPTPTTSKQHSPPTNDRCSPAAKPKLPTPTMILELCLGDRAPYGLIEFFNAGIDEQHD